LIRHGKPKSFKSGQDLFPLQQRICGIIGTIKVQQFEFAANMIVLFVYLFYPLSNVEFFAINILKVIYNNLPT